MESIVVLPLILDIGHFLFLLICLGRGIQIVFELLKEPAFALITLSLLFFSFPHHWFLLCLLFSFFCLHFYLLFFFQFLKVEAGVTELSSFSNTASRAITFPLSTAFIASQDTRSTHKSQLYFQIPAKNKWKPKLEKQYCIQYLQKSKYFSPNLTKLVQDLYAETTRCWWKKPKM